MAEAGQQDINNDVKAISEKIKTNGKINISDFEDKVREFNDIKDVNMFDNIEWESTIEKEIKELLKDAKLWEHAKKIYAQKELLVEVVKKLRYNEDIKKIEESSKVISEKSMEINELKKGLPELKEKSEELETKNIKKAQEAITISDNIYETSQKINSIKDKAKKIKIKMESWTESEDERTKLEELDKGLKKEKTSLSNYNDRNKQNLLDNKELDKKRINLLLELETKESNIEKAKEELENQKEELKDISYFSNNKSIGEACTVVQNIAAMGTKSAEWALDLSNNVNKIIASASDESKSTKYINVENKESIIDNNGEIVKTEEEVKKLTITFEQLNKSKIYLSAIDDYYYEKDIEYYKENPEFIVNITNEKKLWAILSELNFSLSIPFIDCINEKFLDNLNVLEKYSEHSNNQLSIKDIKNFDITNIKNKEIQFFKLLPPATLRFFLITNYIKTDIDGFNKKVTKNDNDEYKNRFNFQKETLSYFLKISWEDEGNDKDQIKDFSLDNFNLSKYKWSPSQLDNTLYDLSDKKENTDKILKLFEWKNVDKLIDKLYDLPKTLLFIKNNSIRIEKIILTQPTFYNKFLSTSEQKQHSLIYVWTILKNSKDPKTDETLHDNISKCKFSNIENAIYTFTILSSYKLNLVELLEHPKMRSSILSIMPKNEDEMKNIMKNINEDDKKTMLKMEETLSNYYSSDGFNTYNERYKNSKIEETINNKEIINKNKSLLYNNLEYKNFITEHWDVGWYINTLAEHILSKNKEGIKNSIIEFKWIDKMTENKFHDILNDLNIIIKNIETKNYKKKYSELIPSEQKKLEKTWTLNEWIITEETKIKFNNFITLEERNAKKTKKIFNKEKSIDIYIDENYGTCSNKAKELIKEQLNWLETTEIIETTKEKIDKNGKNYDKSFFKNLSEDPEKAFSDLDEEIKEKKIIEILKYEKEHWKIEYTDLEWNKIFQDRDLDLSKRYELTEDWRLIDNHYEVSNIDSDTKSITLKDWTTLNWLNSEEYNDIVWTDREWNKIIKNREAFKNLIKFKDTLKELQIPNIWDNRTEIFSALWEKFWSAWFNTTWDYIDKKELSLFLNSILQSVWIETIDINSISIKWFKTKFKEKNNLQLNWEMADNLLKKWESNIEEIFLEKFVNNKSDFQIWEFKKTLSNSNNNEPKTTK